MGTRNIFPLGMLALPYLPRTMAQSSPKNDMIFVSSKFFDFYVNTLDMKGRIPAVTEKGVCMVNAVHQYVTFKEFSARESSHCQRS